MVLNGTWPGGGSTGPLRANVARRAGRLGPSPPEDDDLRLVEHGEVHRGRDEAVGRGLGGDGLRCGDHRVVRDRDPGTQGHRGEVPALADLAHRADRAVGVGAHHDAVVHRGVQVAEQVALRERREQQLLGVPPRPVAAEGGVGGAEQVGLAGDPQQHVAPVVAVARGAGAAVALPGDVEGVVVVGHAPILAHGRGDRAKQWREQVLLGTLLALLVN